MIARLELDVPGARHGLLHSMDAIRELQFEAKGGNHSSELKERMHKCKEGGEVSSKSICQACIMRQWVNEKN